MQILWLDLEDDSLTEGGEKVEVYHLERYIHVLGRIYRCQFESDFSSI